MKRRRLPQYKVGVGQCFHKLRAIPESSQAGLLHQFDRLL